MSSPFEEYNQAHAERWKILADIPDWEQKNLLTWLYMVFVSQSSDVFGAKHTSFNSGIITAIESKNRLLVQRDLGINTNSWNDLRASLQALIIKDSKKVILFLELVVIHIRAGGERYISYGNSAVSADRILNRLESILANGSLWKVVVEQGAGAGFIERVDGHLMDIAQAINDKELNGAWLLAFQPTPNPEKAIEHAQSAVESIASKHNLTKATSKVFGTLLGDIKSRKSQSYVSIAKPAFDLSNVLAGEKSKEVDVNDQFADWFAMGLNLIQKSNPARHKSQKTTDFKVSPETAKQAVLIATVACQFIKEGYIAKLEPTEPKKDKLSAAKSNN